MWPKLVFPIGKGFIESLLWLKIVPVNSKK